MKKYGKVLAWLLMAALLLSGTALAEPDWPEVDLRQGQTVVLSGTLYEDIPEGLGKWISYLKLDQPLDIYMIHSDGSFSEAMLSAVQVMSASDLSGLMDKHVMVMGDVLFGGSGDAYCAVVIQNAAVAESDSFATVAAEGTTPSAPSTPSQNVKATGSVNVRTGPGQSYESLGTMAKGEQVAYLNDSYVDSRGVTWYKVQYYSFGQGWVSSTYAQLVSGGATGVASTDSAVSGDYVRATGGKSNMRKGPGLGYDSVGTLPKDATALYLNQNSVDERGVRWYYISYNGKNAWVSSRYTTLEWSYSYGDVPSWDTSTLYVRATARVNARTGPGIEYDSFNTLQKDEQVLYLGETRYDTTGVIWYKVQYYSLGTAWVSSVYSMLVSDAAGSAGVPSTETSVVGTYVQATGGKSNVRSLPNLQGDELCTIQKGECATYLGCTSVDERGTLWYYVDFEGTVGWVSSRYTTLY